MSNPENEITTGRYGVQESNTLTTEHVAFRERLAHGEVDFTDRRLAKIVRLRLLGEYGFPYYDLSYCYGELADGTAVRVRMPFYQIPRKTGVKRFLISMCQESGVYGKGLGLFDDGVISILR
jgi:hypothetical protein